MKQNVRLNSTLGGMSLVHTLNTISSKSILIYIFLFMLIKS